MDIVSLGTALPGSNAELAEMLLTPEIVLDLNALPRFWRRTEIVFTCRMPAGFVPGIWMVRSVRGAWGRRLHSMPSRAGQPSAFAALFEHHAVIGRNHVARPYTLRVQAERDQVQIVLTLFGRSECWRDDAIEALASALAQGIGLWENSATLKPWVTENWHWRRHEMIEVPPWRPQILMSFDTPFKPGSSAVFAGGISEALIALSVRLRGLARWMGIDLRCDWRSLHAELRHITATEVHPQAQIDGLMKWTGPHPKIAVPVVGLSNALWLEHVPESAWPLLILGSTMQIGGHWAYGFGAYRI